MSYQGITVEIPLGLDGLTGTKNLSQALPTQLLIARNVTYENGPVQKEGGATKYNSTPISGSPSVLGGWDWWPDQVTQRMIVVLSDGTAKKDTGGGTFGTTLASGLIVTSIVPIFVEGGKEAAANNRKLFLFTKSNQVKVLSGDGATIASITTPPADWAASFPASGFVHEGRLWGFGNANDPHRAYYSTTGNHEDFTGAGSGSLVVYPGEGQYLALGLSYKGLIILAKYPRGIYYIDTTDPTVTNWKVGRITDAIGGSGPQAFCIIDNDLIFVDPAGNVQQASAVTEFGNLGSINLSQRALMSAFIQETFNQSRKYFIKGIYYAAKRQAHFAWSQSDSTFNDGRLVVDFMRLDVPRFRFSDRDTCESLWLRLDANNTHRPVHGDSAGTVWLMDNDSRSKAGAYSGEAQIPHLDFGNVDPRYPTENKTGDFLELVVEPKGNWNVTADIIWDGKVRQTVQFNMGTLGSALGTFIIGVDKLGADQVLSRKRRIVGQGRRFSAKFSNNGDGQDFSLAKAFLGFRVSDEALRK